MTIRSFCFKQTSSDEEVGITALDADWSYHAAGVMRDLRGFTGAEVHVLLELAEDALSLARENAQSIRVRWFRTFLAKSALNDLISQQDAQVAKVISRGSGNNGIAEHFKKRIGVKTGECATYSFVSADTIARDSARPSDGTAIDYSACGRAIAVDPVGASTQYGYIESRYLLGAGKGKLLISSADTSIGDGNGHFSARDQTHSGYFAPQTPQTIE
jgi:hypothetical protein